MLLSFTDDFCPDNCRGEVRDEVCAEYFTAQGLYKTKNYRNYCKYREAKCKLRNVQQIELTYIFHGNCDNPPKKATTVAATTKSVPSVTTSPKKEETVTTAFIEEEFVPGIVTENIDEQEPAKIDDKDPSGIFVTEETLAATLIDGRPLPEVGGTDEPDEYVTEIIYEGDDDEEETGVEATVEPEDLKETPPPSEIETEPEVKQTPPPADDLETESPEVEEVTEIIISMEETEEPVEEEEQTEAPVPLVEAQTQASLVEGTEETIVETEITLIDETDVPPAEDEDEETQAPPVDEETEEIVTEVIELQSTAIPEEVIEEEGEVTSAPEELQETPSPERPDTPPPGDDEEEEVPVIVGVLQQCLDEYQNCFNEVPDTNDVVEIINSFAECMGEFQICLAENPALGSNGPIESPDIPPS